MKTTASPRDQNLHHARALLAQARTFRKREKAQGWGGAFSSWLLNKVGEARLRAAGREVSTSRCGEVSTKFGPWWRSPKGIVFKYDQSGFNGVQCFSTPVDYAGRKKPGQYLWHPFVVRFFRVPAFLQRCEYLGKEFPAELIEEQVSRFASRGKKPEPKAAKKTEQLELFA